MTWWDRYINNNKNLKYAISIDRIDKNKGYILDNIEFVTHGFNSWKDNITPIEVIFKDKKYYFLSSEEGSRYFGEYARVIGACLRKEFHCKKEYIVNISIVRKVLKNKNAINLKEYYNTYIENKCR